jgi:hypothetical protein
MTYAHDLLRSAVDEQRRRNARPMPSPAETPITEAHRDEIVRQLQAGALSSRSLCVQINGSTPAGLRVDRGLVRRTLASAIDRGDVIAVLVRRRGQSRRHRERRPFYVYAPAPHRLAPPLHRVAEGRPQVLRARPGVLGP